MCAMFAIVGKTGHGKGVLAVHAMWKSWQAGRFIATNMDLTERCPWADDAFRIGKDVGWPLYEMGKGFWEDLPRGTDIFIDEAELYFDSGDYKQLDKICGELIANQRKLDLNLYFTVKRIGNLYGRFRGICDAYYGCRWNYQSSWLYPALERLLGRDLRPYTKFIVEQYEDEKMKDAVRTSKLSYAACAKRYFGLYETKQIFSV